MIAGVDHDSVSAIGSIDDPLAIDFAHQHDCLGFMDVG